jgi:hypothetical protein
MTASDKKKTGILALLLLIGGLSWYFFIYRPTLIPAADATAKAADAKKKAIKPLGDAQLHTDLIDPPGNLDVGQKNLFQYRQKPVPPKPATPNVFPSPPPSPIIDSKPQPPSQPAPAPYKAFKYDGFSMIKNGKPLASISEGGITYQAKEGDCVLGQYCITRITENVIEIQDILLKRSQTVSRTTQ